MQTKIELKITRQNSGYDVGVIESASGREPQATVTLDVESLIRKTSDLECKVMQSAAPTQGASVDDLETPLRQVGSELFEAVFAGEIAEVYRESLAVARGRGTKLQVVLRLTPELEVLPWEALYDNKERAYICQDEPLVRHIDGPFPESPPIELPLRILGVVGFVAVPPGKKPFSVEEEKRRLQRALQPLSGQVHIEWSTNGSWSNLIERLKDGPWHVLHFIGHGEYDPYNDQGRIALVGEDGRADWRDAMSLAKLINQAEPTPRLVVLSSCRSGHTGGRDLFSGVASTLVRRGVSAVAAMQFSVSDPAALAFSRGFYRVLALHHRLDQAVQAGRMAILQNPRSLEWVTPVLYVRGESTELFNFTSQQHAGTDENTAPEHRSRRTFEFSPTVTINARDVNTGDIAVVKNMPDEEEEER
jgi:CHAT domain